MPCVTLKRLNGKNQFDKGKPKMYDNKNIKKLKRNINNNTKQQKL